MLRFDLHVHTIFSKDGHDRVEDILLAAVKKGLDGIAITDHDTTEGARYAIEVAKKITPGLIVIPGEEVSTRSGHLIVLGITQDIPPRMPVKDTIAMARKMGGTIVVPHPDQRLRHGMKIPPGADAVEVFNSRYILGYHNFFAKRRARLRMLPGVAGSDAHTATMVGTAITEIDADDRTVEAVLRAIRDGKTRTKVKKTPMYVYLSQIGKGWVRKIKAVMKKR